MNLIPIHPDNTNHSFDLSVLNNFLNFCTQHDQLDQEQKDDITKVINNLKFLKCNLDFIGFLYEKKFSKDCYNYGPYLKKFNEQEDINRKIFRDYGETSVDLFFYETKEKAISFIKNAMVQYERVIEQMQGLEKLLFFAKSIEFDANTGCIAARLDRSLKFAANILGGHLNLHDLMLECSMEKEFDSFPPHINVRRALQFFSIYMGLSCEFDGKNEIISKKLILDYLCDILGQESQLNIAEEYKHYLNECSVHQGFHGMIQHQFENIKKAGEFKTWLNCINMFEKKLLTKFRVKKETYYNKNTYYVIRLTKGQVEKLSEKTNKKNTHASTQTDQTLTSTSQYLRLQPADTQTHIEKPNTLPISKKSLPFESVKYLDEQKNNFLHSAAQASDSPLLHELFRPDSIFPKKTLQELLGQYNQQNQTPLNLILLNPQTNFLFTYALQILTPEQFKEILLGNRRGTTPLVVSLISSSCSAYAKHQYFIQILNKITERNILSCQDMLTHANQYLKNENIFHLLAKNYLITIIHTLVNMLPAEYLKKPFLQLDNNDKLPLDYYLDKLASKHYKPSAKAFLLSILYKMRFIKYEFNIKYDYNHHENLLNFAARHNLIEIIITLAGVYKPEVFSTLLLTSDISQKSPLSYLINHEVFVPENIFEDLFELKKTRLIEVIQKQIQENPYSLLYLLYLPFKTFRDRIIGWLNEGSFFRSSFSEKNIYREEDLILKESSPLMKTLYLQHRMPQFTFSTSKPVYFFKIALDLLLFKYFNQLHDATKLALFSLVLNSNGKNIFTQPGYFDMYLAFFLAHLRDIPQLILVCLKKYIEKFSDVLQQHNPSKTDKTIYLFSDAIEKIITAETEVMVALKTVSNLVYRYFETTDVVYENMDQHRLMMLLWPVMRALYPIQFENQALESYADCIIYTDKIITAQGTKIDLDDPQLKEKIILNGIFHPFEIIKLQCSNKLDAVELCEKLAFCYSLYSGVLNLSAFHQVLSHVLNGESFIKMLSDSKKENIFFNMLNDINRFRPPLRVVKKGKQDKYKLNLKTLEIASYEKLKNPKTEHEFLKKNSVTYLSNRLQTRVFYHGGARKFGVVIHPKIFTEPSRYSIDYIVSAMMTEDKGTYRHWWIGNEKILQKIASKMKKYLVNNFSDFKERIETMPPEQGSTNEVLLRFHPDDIIGSLVIYNNDNYDYAKELNKLLSTILKKERYIIVYHRQLNRIWVWETEFQNNSRPSKYFIEQSLNFFQKPTLFQRAKEKCLKIRDYLNTYQEKKSFLWFSDSTFKTYQILIKKIDTALSEESQPKENFSWQRLLQEILLHLKSMEKSEFQTTSQTDVMLDPNLDAIVSDKAMRTLW